MIHILLVDDEVSFLHAVRDSLAHNEDFIFDLTSSAEEALEKLNHSRYDVIVSDYSMPDMNGFELLTQIRRSSSIPFILFTGKGNEHVIIEAINQGVDFYLKKGDDPDILFAKLTHMIRQAADKKSAEERIQEKDQKYRELFENSSIATMMYNPDRILIDINPAALSLFGLPSAAEMKGTPLFMQHTISDENIADLYSGKTLRYSKILNIDDIVPVNSYPGTRHGLIYADISIIPHLNKDGTISEYYVQIIDLTAQYRAEEALLQTSEQLSQAITGSQIGIWDWEVQTGELTVNERWADIIGYTLDELKPISIQTWNRLTHPDDLKDSSDLIQKHFSGDLPFYEYEARMKHKNGEWVWIHDRGNVTEWDSEGKPVRMVGTHTDISGRKRAEEEIRKKTEELDQFFSVALDMLCIANTEGEFTLLNPAWELTLGWTKDELMAGKFLDFVHPEDINATLDAISDLANQKDVINFVNRYRCRNGTYRWIEWRSAPVKDSIYAAARDITEKRENEALLIHKKNILDAISYAATTLMSSLSDDAINNVLARIGRAVDASRTYIFTHSYTAEGRSIISYSYEWVSEGINPQMNDPLLQNLEWQNMGYKRWASVLMQRGIISGIVRDFPKEEQTLLIRQDIKSLAAMPIFSHNDFFGFIGFDHCIKDHEWTHVEIETLEAAAGLLGASFGRRKAEEEVKIRENNFSTFFDTIDDFLFVLDMQGMMIKVNDTVISRLGYRKEELIGESVLMVHPEKRRGEAGEKVAAMLSGTCDFCPIPLVAKDGTQIPVETRVVPGVWDGQPALFGVSKDISEITLSEEKFSKAFQAGGSLMAISIDSVFVNVNKTFLDTLGYTWDEVIGKSSMDLDIFVEDGERDQVVKEIQEKGYCRNLKVLVRGKDGRILTGIFSADIIQIQDKEALLTIMNDVTEMIRLSDALLSANKKLNLLSSITRHDILNQVQALFFVKELLEMKIPEDSAARGELTLLTKAVDTIYRQINFTKDYQDMGIASPVWVQVKEVVMKEQANKIFSDISIEITTGDIEVFVDPMFSKVCYNLLENSLRHGKRVTRITVSWKSEVDYGILIFEDDGVGVAKADKKKIFNRSFGKNTGLGLFLTAEILSITGLSIEETGEEGKGARFEIRIPMNEYRHGDTIPGSEL
ncbi:MAG: PAS domain S-box protein [Methanomicrobiales archaeon]|nr:PAS domain S-box protein [Methanomicrobiales archaeon]